MTTHDRWSLRGSLVVSCQAPPGSPLDDPRIIAALAEAAVMGGAAGIRVNGPLHIRAVKATVRVPVIGLLKRRVDGSPVYITPTLQDALEVADAGADIVAIDATLRPRPDRRAMGDIIARIHECDVGVVADVDSLDAAIAAAAAGADFVASTLAGYTGASVPTEPAIDLVAAMARTLRTPVIAEGRYRTPDDVEEAFRAGAFAVVVGAAITNPTVITRRLVAVTRSKVVDRSDGSGTSEDE
jgi:N-acylglucosamine-6-phosphate 2-epimerase